MPVFGRDDYAGDFRPIGVIAGSGPEAGVDLFNKILLAARAQLGERYAGDANAPFVHLVSDPALGQEYTRRTKGSIDRALRRHLGLMRSSCAAYSIACNALQAMAKRLVKSRNGTVFVTFDTAVRRELEARHERSFFLLGASRVMSLGADSVYHSLACDFEIKTPRDMPAVDALIRDIKLTGGRGAGLAERLQSMVAEAGSRPAVLACTDFPLVAADFHGSVVIDATDAVARELISIASAPT